MTNSASTAIMCPVHGSALCPEDYMLRSDGTPWADYADVWDESIRCGQRRENSWGFTQFTARVIVHLADGGRRSEDISDAIKAARQYLSGNDSECYTLPNGECVAPVRKLHGPLGNGSPPSR